MELVHFLLIELEGRVDSVLDFWVVCASVRFGELELVKVMKGAAMVDITGITPGVKTTKFRWPRLSE